MKLAWVHRKSYTLKPKLFEWMTGIIEVGAELPCPVDADGNFTAEVFDFQGRCRKFEILQNELYVS